MRTPWIGLILAAVLLTSACSRGPATSGSSFNQCTGTSQSRSIKGGTFVPGGGYPNVGGIYWAPADGNAAFGPDDFVCTGSIVAPGYVLTAGHCSYVDEGKLTAPEEFAFSLLNNTDPNFMASLVPVVALRPHPEYSISKNIGPDFSVMKLADPLVGSCSFAPIQNHGFVPGELATAVGLGLQTNGAFGVKKQASLYFSSYRTTQTETGTSYPNGTLYFANSFFTDSTCPGDSGSPLYASDGSLVGILSSGSYFLGITACSTAASSLYTSVPLFQSWIDSTLSSL